MDIINTFLFIGGPKDGERIEVMPPDRERVYMPIYKIPQGQINEGALVSYELEKIAYERVLFSSENNRYAVYVVEGMRADEVFVRLFERYVKSPVRRARA